MTEIAYRRIAVDSIEIFYREAGRSNAPALLLLHGFPTASHMFRDLIPQLADRFHVIAPDSDMRRREFITLVPRRPQGRTASTGESNESTLKAIRWRAGC